MRITSLTALGALLFTLGCDESPTDETDASRTDAGSVDEDGGPTADAGPPTLARRSTQA